MRIAVVDDEKYILEKVRGELNDFVVGYRDEISVDCFLRGELLLMQISEGKSYDVYLLDIEMKSENGIVLPKKIRESQGEAYIIFITNYDRYAIEGYDVKAYQYILKNQITEKLRLTMEAVYVDFTDKKQKSFIIETNSRYEKIPYHDIYYIYKEGKNTIFVTIHGKSRVRMTLQAVYEKLAQSEFIYVDRGYIVNIRYVKKFQNQELCLINGDILPISRSHMQAAKAQIGAYWRDKL